MGTTLSVILLIAIVIVAGLLRDSMRTGAVTRWAGTHGFVRVLPPEHDNKRLIAWAQRFRAESTGHWGIVLRGQAGGLDTTIAEHEERRGSRNAARWHTLAVTHVPGLRLDAVRITQAVGSHRPVHPVGQGKWGIDVVNENARAFWSSEPQVAAIEAWPHDAELAAVDDYVLVRVPGFISAAGLDDILASADAARALFTQAAAQVQ